MELNHPAPQPYDKLSIVSTGTDFGKSALAPIRFSCHGCATAIVLGLGWLH